MDPRSGGIPVCNRHQVEGRGGSGESSFAGERDPLRSQGEGEYQSVTGTKRGEGAVVSHPFLGERWETVMSHPKGRGGGA